MSPAPRDGGLGVELERYAAALWGGRFEVKFATSSTARSTFDERLLLLPPVGSDATPAERQLAHARVAHAAAHVAFSGARLEVGSLKPVQQALAGLFEDARVEALAMQLFPGLRRLWARFHELPPPTTGPAPAPAIFARLSRALFDPTYADPDSWVRKACEAFRAQELEPADFSRCRRLGNLLGNELGQMRLPFDARQYLVEPCYRDDHVGLWQQPPQPAAMVSREPSKTEAGGAQAPSPETTHAYPEWDYVIARARPGFCEVRELPVARPARPVPSSQSTSSIARRVRRVLRRALRPTRRGRRESEGAELDLAVVVDAAAERRAGCATTLNLYRRPARLRTARSVLLLLDLSESSNTPRADGSRVPELTLACARLLCGSSLPGLELAIDGFNSYGRKDVRYLCFKDFAAPPAIALERLEALRAEGSTRLGAALRHAHARLQARGHADKLLLVVTDADPADIDVYDDRYLVEDARLAVSAARRAGIGVFACCLQGGVGAVQRRIFGRQRATLARLDDLAKGLEAAFSAQSARPS